MGMMYIMRKHRRKGGSDVPFWVLGAISAAMMLIGLGLWIL